MSLCRDVIGYLTTIKIKNGSHIIVAAFSMQRRNHMSKEPFEHLPDVLDAKQLAEALQISKAGAYNLLNSEDFPTLRIGGRKLVMKNDLLAWLKSRTNRKT